MDAAENLRAYGGDPSHSMHPDAYITQGSYTFMNGAMDAPLKDGSGAPIEDSGGVEAQQSSTSGLGTLYTNNQLAAGASFNASRSPPVPSSTNSWELTINGGAGGSLYAGGSSLPNILINGSGLMASNSNPTAQLLIGGLQSFNETDHGTVYYPPSQGQHAHAEAMQLVYVNGGGYGHNSFDRGLAYNNGQDHSTSDNNNQNSSGHQQSAYGVSFLSQPLMEQPRQSYSNWQRTGGNEHSFLPVNDVVEPQSHHSLFGAVLQGRNDHEQQQLAQQVMAVEGTTNHSQGAGSNSNIAVNGQGMLSLSLSSHQPHFQQLPPGESASASEAQMVAQAAALAKTKELASRYLAGSEANNAADLSRFRTPTREFHHESKKPGGSSSQLTASQFLQSVQSILNELCKVTPLKRAPKPASSTEQQQYPLRSSSASVNATYNGYHGKDHDLHAAEASVGRDPQSSVASLSDASHLVTVSHIPLQAEMMTDAARSSGTGRDDLEFKKGQLIRMLDEVEARFRRYSDQLQVTCAGFNAQAGPNAATPYTILALQAMSRHFRCLKDAVKNQLKVVRRALGEEDVAAGFNGETTRLRYVDQQIRQQRALQQLGMLQQHAWRPQRGLPERAVSVLRAWLFEHFLHPYPKDVDKMSLAKQTGLTRSQVSNWFINARVRLWKPMVEEMYVEEQREAAELALQSDRMAREQVNMAYEQFEAAGNSNNNNNNNNNNRGREDLTANGVQHSSVMSNVEYRTTTTTTTTTTNDQDQGAGPSSLTTEVASQALYRQQQQQQEDHTFNNYEGGPREPKRAKTALETVSDAFNSNTVTSSILRENNNHGHGTPAAEDDVVPSSELEARNKLKGKSSVVDVEENMNQPSYVTSQGAFVSYGENGMNHHRYEGVQGYVAASTAVSLTLGLRHCDAANMSLSTTSVAPVLDKYDMDADLARMDPLDRDEYLHDARMHDHVNHGTSYHEVQQHRDQHHGQDVEENHHGANNITQHAGNVDHGLPGGATLTTPAFENHHEFTDAH